jgi:acetyltransferase-like isoleucine patch superfamily enzyme
MKSIARFILLLFKLPRFLFAKIYNFISLNASVVSYKAYPVITGKLIIKGEGKISIGNNVIINSSLSANPVGLATQTVLFAYQNSEIIIGNNVGISNALLCSMEQIIIEDDIRIGGGAQIFDNDFHSVVYKQRIAAVDTDIKIMPVRIKKGAFIGCNSIIGKGVTVGERSIVAAGSVVVKNIPDDEIWGGNPAIFIKKIEN